MMLEEQEVYFGALSNDLSKIRDYCRTCEATLLHYKELKPTEDDSSRVSADLAEPMPAPEAPPAAEPATVLVADDNEVSRDLLVRALEREGHHVDASVRRSRGTRSGRTWRV